MMTLKDEGVDGNVKGVDFLFKKNKIDAFIGAGRIAAPGKVEVTGDDGKTQTLETKNIVIATGSDVAPLQGVDDRREAHRLLDRRAGAAGRCRSSCWSSAPASSASSSARSGAGSAPKVTVVEFLDRILPGMDGEVAKQFQRLLEKQGMKFKLSSKVTGGRHVGQDGSRRRSSRPQAARPRRIEADVVLVAIGRVPYTEGLGLEEAGVELDERGRVVDRRITSRPTCPASTPSAT